MRTKVSTKGQVVLPSRIRHTLGLQPGDSLDAEMEGERIILTPRRARRGSARIVKDATRLTSAQVREILADFP